MTDLELFFSVQGGARGAVCICAQSLEAEELPTLSPVSLLEKWTAGITQHIAIRPGSRESFKENKFSLSLFFVI